MIITTTDKAVFQVDLLNPCLEIGSQAIVIVTLYATHTAKYLLLN